MIFDTTSSPPMWIHIGIVHGGVVCSDFYKNLDFPEIFSRTEDSEVLEFIKNIMDGDSSYYDGDCDFFSEDYEDCIAMKNQCKTVDGAACIFPFIFRGKEIRNCISTPPRRTKPWCPTESDVRGEWGYCNNQCPTEESEIGKLALLMLSNHFCMIIYYDFLIVTVNCQWSDWSFWSSCSKTCGDGIKERSRHVQTLAKNGGSQCQGLDKQTENCNDRDCLGKFFIL